MLTEECENVFIVVAAAGVVLMVKNLINSQDGELCE
jgi:hypothetical protein